MTDWGAIKNLCQCLKCSPYDEAYFLRQDVSARDHKDLDLRRMRIMKEVIEDRPTSPPSLRRPILDILRRETPGRIASGASATAGARTPQP